MQSRYLRHHVEPQPISRRIATRFTTIQAAENGLTLLGGYSWAGVVDAQAGSGGVDNHPDICPRLVRSELEDVVEQIAGYIEEQL